MKDDQQSTEPAVSKENKADKHEQSVEMHVKVYAPFKVYFDGMAESISAENATGEFDILPMHHNFMTLLSPCEIVVRYDGKEEKIRVSRGIMHVKADDVVVFLDV